MIDTAGAEGGARRRGDHRLGEDPLGELVSAAEIRDVRKYVEGSPGDGAADPDLREP